MLCGISVLFRTLFPSWRQVTHALLTRPPLNLSNSIRKLPLISSVRLACVRHAASVRPEPGSNSLKFVSQHLSMFKSILELDAHFRYTNVSVIFSVFSLVIVWVFTQSHYGFLLFSLFNFQGPVSLVFPILISFFRPQRFAVFLSSRAEQLLLYSIYSRLSTLFFAFFWVFFSLTFSILDLIYSLFFYT